MPVSSTTSCSSPATCSSRILPAAARILGEPFHVVTFDKSQHEYYAKLSDFHTQFRIVGNNYNQTIKELKCHFSERRAMALVCKLEKYMMQLVQIMHKVIEQTDEYQKNIQKSGENNINM